MTDIRKQRHVRTSKREGFTLIEVTISLFMLLFFLVSLSELMVAASRLVRSMEARYPENPTVLYLNSGSSTWERRFGVSAVLSPTIGLVGPDTNILLRTVQITSFIHNYQTGEVRLNVAVTEPPP